MMTLLPPLRHPIHYLAGFISGASAYYSPALPIASTASFLVYEVVQAKYKGDKGYPDIIEFCIGQFFALVPLTILKALAII